MVLRSRRSYTLAAQYILKKVDVHIHQRNVTSGVAMILSKTAEYALRATVFLAQHLGRTIPRAEIVAATQVPEEYLVKVLRRLASAELVRIRRGAGGGYTLARGPEAISVWDIVAAIDPVAIPNVCPLGLAEHTVRLCPLHATICQVTRDAIEAYSRVLLRDLIPRATRRRQACDFPVGNS